MSITKAIVDEMGGEIGVESDGNDGSTFWFRIELPIQDSERPAIEDRSVHSTAAKVLIVGDIAINHAILAEQMTAWNCEPITLTSATAALQYLKEFPLDELKVDRSFVMELPGNRAGAGAE